MTGLTSAGHNCPTTRCYRQTTVPPSDTVRCSAHAAVAAHGPSKHPGDFDLVRTVPCSAVQNGHLCASEQERLLQAKLDAFRKRFPHATEHGIPASVGTRSTHPFLFAAGVGPEDAQTDTENWSPALQEVSLDIPLTPGAESYPLLVRRHLHPAISR